VTSTGQCQAQIGSIKNMLNADPRMRSQPTLMWEQMGKVQDTIQRMRTVSSSDVASPVALLVPNRHSPAANSFPTTSARVATWLEAQPWSGNSNGNGNGNGITILTRALTSPLERLRILALFDSRFLDFGRTLRGRFTGFQLPLAKDASLAFNQLTVLQQEMSFGYKIALLDVLQRRHRLARKHRLPAIYQAIKFLGQLGVTHSQIHRQWPTKIWRDINTLYLLAEREKSVDIDLSGTASGGVYQGNLQAPSTIRELYAQLCAFTVSDTDRLNALQIETLFRALGRNTRLLEFSEQKPLADPACIYSIAINGSRSAAPDRYCLYDKSAMVRYFSMQNFSGVDLQDACNQSDKTIGAISRACQHRLNRQWSGEANRAGMRSVKNTELFTQTGIKEIYASIAMRPPTRPQANNPASDIGGPNPPLLDKTVQGPTTENEYDTRWTVLNQSQNGLCLHWTGRGSCRAQTGDALSYSAYNPATGELRWQTAIIRWLSHESSESLICGTETIASHTTDARTWKTPNKQTAKPGKSDEFNGHSESKEEALLLNDHPDATQPLMLFFVNHRYKLGDTLHMQTSEDRSLVKLIEKIDFSADFHSFAIRKISVEKPGTKPYSKALAGSVTE